jgi:hypothetical protein
LAARAEFVVLAMAAATVVVDQMHEVDLPVAVAVGAAMLVKVVTVAHRVKLLQTVQVAVVAVADLKRVEA